MTAVERLDAIEARAAAATPGPWFREYGDVVTAADDPRDDGDEEPRSARVSRRAEHLDNRDPQGIANAEFIAAARADVPALVAALRAVLALHLPVWSTLADGYRCIGCDVPLTDVTPNCPTVATITAALDQS